MSKIIEGEYTSAKVYRDDIENYAEAQIKMLCDMKIHKDAKIQIMPDVHPRKVATIGFTMIIHKENAKIMPALVGNDIGCGILCAKIKPKKKNKISYDALDKAINNVLNNAMQYNMRDIDTIDTLKKYSLTNDFISMDDLLKSCGTLGNGNHFIELDEDDENNLYTIIHTGSRNIGNKIYEYYMNLAHKNTPELPYELSYLSDKNQIDEYTTDAFRAAIFGTINRTTILKRICKSMNWSYDLYDSSIVNVHNMIYTTEYDDIVITKGANMISSNNPKVILPINSIDGCIIGECDNIYKYTFMPHGAGRIIKRTEVANSHTANEYKKLMNSHKVYCNDYKNTLDEAPFAYRSINDILPEINNLGYFKELKRLTPIYNYKSK